MSAAPSPTRRAERSPTTVAPSLLSSTSNQTITSNNTTFYDLAINDGLRRLLEARRRNGHDRGGRLRIQQHGDPFRSRRDLAVQRARNLTFTNPYSVALNGSTGYVTLGASDLPANNAAQTISLLGKAELHRRQPEHHLPEQWVEQRRPAQGHRRQRSAPTPGEAPPTRPGPPPSTGVWHHIAYTYNGASGQTLYIDGVATTATVANQTATPTVAYLGVAIARTARSFNGSVDDVRIYSRALSATEIKCVGHREPTRHHRGDPVAVRNGQR